MSRITKRKVPVPLKPNGGRPSTINPSQPKPHPTELTKRKLVESNTTADSASTPKRLRRSIRSDDEDYCNSAESDPVNDSPVKKSSARQDSANAVVATPINPLGDCLLTLVEPMVTAKIAQLAQQQTDRIEGLEKSTKKRFNMLQASLDAKQESFDSLQKSFDENVESHKNILQELQERFDANVASSESRIALLESKIALLESTRKGDNEKSRELYTQLQDQKREYEQSSNEFQQSKSGLLKLVRETCEQELGAFGADIAQLNINTKELPARLTDAETCLAALGVETSRGMKQLADNVAQHQICAVAFEKLQMEVSGLNHLKANVDKLQIDAKSTQNSVGTCLKKCEDKKKITLWCVAALGSKIEATQNVFAEELSQLENRMTTYTDSRLGDAKAHTNDVAQHYTAVYLRDNEALSKRLYDIEKNSKAAKTCQTSVDDLVDKVAALTTGVETALEGNSKTEGKVTGLSSEVTGMKEQADTTQHAVDILSATQQSTDTRVDRLYTLLATHDTTLEQSYVHFSSRIWKTETQFTEYQQRIAAAGQPGPFRPVPPAQFDEAAERDDYSQMRDRSYGYHMAMEAQKIRVPIPQTHSPGRNSAFAAAVGSLMARPVRRS